MRTQILLGALALSLTGPAVLGQEIDLRVTGLSQNNDGKLEVPAGGTVNWQIWATVADDGDPATGGLAGVSVDLASDLRTVAPTFALSPATSLGLPANFDNQANLGVVTNNNGLSLVQTIGGSQDTPDHLPTMIQVIIDGQPTLVDNPQGTVVPGIGEATATLIAEGNFVVPGDVVAGTEFTLFTGGVPNNPGQTKLASLAFSGPGPDPNDPNNPCGTGDPADCGGDSQWTAFLFDISTIPPLTQTHGPASPLMFVVVGCPAGAAAPELVQVVGSVDAAPDTFVSPLGDGVPFEAFQVELTESAVLNGSEVVYTGAPEDAPAVAGLTDDGGGLHTVALDRALTPGEWARISLTVANGQGCEGTVTVFVAHHPNNVNQDDIVNIRDATAFGDEFRGAKRLLLIDLNGDGIVNVRDATEFGDQWFGRGGASQAWNGTSLPAKP